MMSVDLTFSHEQTSNWIYFFVLHCIHFLPFILFLFNMLQTTKKQCSRFTLAYSDKSHQHFILNLRCHINFPHFLFKIVCNPINSRES